MKRLLLAVLALGILLIITGCPPSTDTTDRFGPGPGRPAVTDEQPAGDQPADTGEAVTDEGAGDTGAEGEMPADEGGENTGGGKPGGNEGGGEKPTDGGE